MEDALAPLVAVGFKRKQNEADGCALSLKRVIEALALNGEGAGVVVGLAVDEHDRGLDLISVGEGAHLVVDLGGLPICAFFILETEGGQGAVIGSGAGNTCAEQIAMG